MAFAIVPAHEISFAEQAGIFNRAFHGYLAGWHDLDAASLARFLTAQGTDLGYSRFVRVRDEPAGFGYINRTAAIPRLAGMGTIPSARRSGAAAYLLAHLLREAKERRDPAMVLEVFEQNHGAVALYQQAGFRVLMRLFGWRGRADAKSGRSGKVVPVPLTAAMQHPSTDDYPDIPWQISRSAMAKLPMAHAFTVGNVCVVLGDLASESIRIHACFSGEGNWGARKNALATVCHHFPGREFFAPAIFPEELGRALFAPLDFVREPLNQYLMRRDL